MPRSSSLSLAGLFALGCLGCQGVIADASKSPGDEGIGTRVDRCVGVIDAPETGWGQLDPVEYEHAVRTILETEAIDIADRLDEHQGSHITLLGAERLDEVAAELVAGHPLGECADDACAEAFLSGVATRAFRRALDDEERAFVLGRFADARAEGADVRRATEMVVAMLLQAPQTIYTPVLGAAGADGLIALSPDELATRMALFLWSGVPDAALRDAAETGGLDTAEGIAEQAARMLDHPRAGVALARFTVDWLGLEGGPTLDPLATAHKDAERFPEMDDAMREAMHREVEMLLTRVIRDSGNVADLFASRDAYVDANLAALYGVDAPEGGEGWVELPAEERAGLLTRAAFLATYAGAEVRSPIRRGVFVIEEVLCRPIGEPPPNANDVAVTGGASEEGEVRSVRDDVDARTRGGECAACHDGINPVGFLFDHYDAIGRFQREEHIEVDEVAHTFAIDARGEIEGTHLDGALELSELLAASEEARACFGERLFEHAVGRHLAPEDECGVAGVQQALIEGGSIREALIALVSAESFRFVRPRSGEGEDR